MLLCELFEAKKKPKQKKSDLIKKKLKVKQKRHRKHVKKVTDEGIVGDVGLWAAGKILAKIGTGGD